MKINDEKLKKDILSITKKNLRHKGVKGCNMDDISKEVGLAKKTLYKMVGTKEKLIESVLLELMKRNFDFLNDQIKQEKDFQKTFNIFCEKFPQRLSNFEPYVMRDIFRDYPDIKVKASKLQENTAQIVLDFFQKSIDAGYIREDVTPAFIFELIRGVVDHFVSSEKSGANFESELTLALRCTVDGLEKRN